MTVSTGLYWDDSLIEPYPDSLGGKSLGLLRLKSCGLKVPRFCVLLPDADPELAVEALKSFNGSPVAVRSSAEAEDGDLASFAGMYETVLGVRTEDELRRAIAHCRRSARSERLEAYRALHNLPESPLAIIIQELVEGEVSGVLFSHDPTMPERSLISAAYGLGEGVVQGTVPCDTFWITAQQVIQRQISVKDLAVRVIDGTVQLVESPAVKANTPCLSDDLIHRLAKHGRHLASVYKTPQDIEWTYLHGELIMLQTRPITVAIPHGERLLWDNSNIIESYYGPTLPLTYSFASRSYTIVYQIFCQVMGVSNDEIRKNSETFARLIGLIKGRIYYNLNAWYRLVSLLPGYQWNRGFLEQMMGVSEVASDADAGAASGLDRMASLARLVKLSAVLTWRVQTLDRRIVHFQETVDRALAPIDGRDLSDKPPLELLRLYGELERKLLWAWSTPIVNDFFVMIAHGVLKSLCSKWLPHIPDLSNRIISRAGNMISARPAQLTQKIAFTVRSFPELVAEFKSFVSDDISAADLRNEMRSFPAVEALYNQYMTEIGHRCADELKLETVTYHHDPSPLLHSIAALLDGEVDAVPSFELGSENRDIARHLKGWRRTIFFRVANWATKRVRSRENLRYDRTRVFAAVREIFRALGHHMAESQAIEHARDVFYLETNEVFGWVRGTSSTVNLTGIVNLRKSEYAQWRNEAAPADRFWTWGPVWRANHFTSPSTTVREGEGINGLAAYPGTVEGRVRCISDPKSEVLQQGEILVCYRTDPGWVPLFPAAAAILVERGSLLSHSAVVARELCIPTIVAIPNLMTLLHTGQRIRVDAAKGTVEVIDE
ncbi:MAG: PEP/pyruvate-binding domain-containing protein [Myxococcota bacterium]